MFLKQASGKTILTLNKADWQFIGKKAGWLKVAEEISASKLYQQFVDEGKAPRAAAEEILGILSSGAFDAIEEPKRTQMIEAFMGKYTLMPKRDMRNLPVRRCSIRCKEHPEWGTWGISEDRGSYYEIRGDRGDRVLDKSEAEKFWELA